MIGDFLRDRLKQLEMSQSDLARELTLRGHSVTRANVSHWINGKHSLPLGDKQFRLRLASALHMDVNEMMMAFGFMLAESSRSAEALRAADLIDQLPEDVREVAVELVEVLVRNYQAE